MKSKEESPTTWQGWFDNAQQGISLDGWLEFMRMGVESGAPLWQWSALYELFAQTSVVNGMLLAVLQQPAADAARTLETVRQYVRTVRFGKLPRGVKRDIKDVYQDVGKMLLRDLPSATDAIHSVFLHYLEGRYEMLGDANLLMREASLALNMQQRERALDLVGRAGAAMLRGRALWAGWADEGALDLAHWALALVSIRDNFTALGIIPLAAIEDERLHAAERAQRLSQHADATDSEISVNEETLTEMLTESFFKEWLELVNQERDLTDAEIEALGKRRDQFIAVSLQVLEAGPHLLEDAPIEEAAEFAVVTLGLLRARDPKAIDALLEVVRDQGEEYNDEAIDDALWSLEQIGAAALPDVFDTVRYTGDYDVRSDLLPVLGRVGRGSLEVYDYLSDQFARMTWDDGKADYAFPLALLHDQRAVEPIVEALRDQAAEEEDVYALLDGLEELGVKFSVNQNKHAVTVAGYGVIADVAIDVWIPRAEREALEASGAGETDDVIPPWADDFDDVEVVYDASGIARCPSCGAVMHKVNGRWEHPIKNEEFMPRPKQLPLRAQMIGRNDPCPCGSGKKYKHCHGKTGASALN